MFKISNFQTPCHIFDLEQLQNNISILKELRKQTNCKILYAIKGCSQSDLLPYISKEIDGACTSGYNEVLIASKCKFKEIHTFSCAYKEDEITEIAKKSNVVIFNSKEQYEKFSEKVERFHATPGLRINPQYSEVKNVKINPCTPYSRFGVTCLELNQMDITPSYLHFHSMCEQYSDALERTLKKIDDSYGKYLNNIQTLNIGGGQLYTAFDYNLTHAISCINSFKEKYNISIIIEPGEAILYNVGYLVGTVLDIKHGEKEIAILDLSAVCHIPDIVFSNYKYRILGGFPANEKKYTYILAGPSCYSGDVFGEFSFESPLCIGSKIIICDTAHYTTVKSSMFNGISLPNIVLYSTDKSLHLARSYGFDEFLALN